MSYALLSLGNLVLFAFAALTFSVLTLFYWRERRARSPVFAVFTLACAAAFVTNLLMRVEPGLAVPDALLDFLAGVLPPMLLHVIYEEEGRRTAPWLVTLAALYAAGAVAVAPSMVLGVCGALGLVLTLLPRTTTEAERRLRTWYRVLLGLTVLCAIADLALLADYLLLAFFCVTLYYKERLIFFDVLIKRGVFFLLALASLTAILAFRGDGERALLTGLLLSPLWLAGPWIYRKLGGVIDRAWLGRRYSIPEAELHFAAETRSALDEDELHDCAVESLAYIFQTRADVYFEPSPEPSGAMVEKLEHRGVELGWIAVDARPDSAPFLSDDRRLFRSIAATLAVLLENVRYRRDDQELRWLASRAELKALRAQIDPHFLFNALNAIAGLIQQQPQLADETIEQLAQVFRYTLSKSGSEWVKLHEEVDFVKAYLRVEQARFGERLRVEFDVEPEVASARIPAMSIQPLIENAVKHGGGGLVGLRAAYQGSSLCIEVFDSGPGFPPDFSLATSTGHGLRNVAARLQGYYRDAAALRWECTAGGTRVSLTIPKTMRVLIVDDEAPARARLRQMLAAHADVEIVGEAETGPQAMQLASELHPDLMLLDIQMPGASGIDVAACLPEPRPRIVFCTAFEQHAIDAFELNAVDYLLKPVSRARLAQALSRVQPVPAGKPHLRPVRFLARTASHYQVVGEARVLCFVSEDGLTRLISDGAQYWMDPTLNELEQRLDPARFFRVSRAALINLNAVAEVHPMPGGSGEVMLKNGQRLEVSRRRFRDLLQFLEGDLE